MVRRGVAAAAQVFGRKFGFFDLMKRLRNASRQAKPVNGPQEQAVGSQTSEKAAREA